MALLAATAWVTLVRPGPVDLPYWWDEADVYVPGSKWVAENDLLVTPGVFPDDYSRGHPILLYFVAGAAFRAFGPGPTTGRLVVLPFTIVALAFTFLLGAALFGRRAGMGAALLLATTPLFMAIGNVLLPESLRTRLTPGGYTWEAWCVVDGLDNPLGRRDFDVISRPDLLARLADLEQLEEPNRGNSTLILLDGNDLASDLRAFARKLPPSEERDRFLALPK